MKAFVIVSGIQSAVKQRNCTTVWVLGNLQVTCAGLGTPTVAANLGFLCHMLASCIDSDLIATLGSSRSAHQLLWLPAPSSPPLLKPTNAPPPGPSPLIAHRFCSGPT